MHTRQWALSHTETTALARLRSASCWSVSSGSRPCQLRCRRRLHAPGNRAVDAVGTVRAVTGVAVVQPAAAAAAAAAVLRPTALRQRQQAAAARLSSRAAVRTDVRPAAEITTAPEATAMLAAGPSGHRLTQVTSLHRAQSREPFGVVPGTCSMRYAVCTIAPLSMNRPKTLLQHRGNRMLRAAPTKRNETKRNETKRNETKRNETKRNETRALRRDTRRVVAEAAVCGGAGARLRGRGRAGLRHGRPGVTRRAQGSARARVSGALRRACLCGACPEASMWYIS